MAVDLEDLLRAARDQVPGAWDRLAPMLDARLVSYFMRWFGAADAEELSQATATIIMQQIPGFMPRKTLSGWTFGIAHHVKIRRFRERYSEQGVQALLAQVDPTANTSPFSRLHKQELLTLLREEIERMPPHYRRAVELELEGCSIKTHARRESISIAAAGVRRHRAHNRLREQIEARRKALSLRPSTPAPS